MNIYDIDTKLGCWVDASHQSTYDLYQRTVALAKNFGFQESYPSASKEDILSWDQDFWDAYDYLNSVCPHGYWFEIRDNSLFLESEDGE